jgi:hypothetical protein
MWNYSHQCTEKTGPLDTTPARTLRRATRFEGLALVDSRCFGFNIDEFLPHIDEMVQEGMDTLERVEVLIHRCATNEPRATNGSPDFAGKKLE